MVTVESLPTGRPLELLRLTNEQGATLTLETLGYEFPQLSSDMLDYDGNWLQIVTSASMPGVEAWTTTQPSLQTHELERIAHQVMRLREAGTGETLQRFLEPDFQLHFAEVAGRWKLTVQLDPNLAPQDKFAESSLKLVFQLDDADLEKFLTNIREILRAWPSRSKKHW